ncbi:MAG TPA: formyltransferase family protein [Candidatus Polarisedimenticolia bacterium]|nr:formyltransferase family protein [Candidatus Polarisedimenticolia bacterium]
MRVVALCDSLRAVARLWRGLSDLPWIDLRFLLFGTGPLAQARAARPSDWRTALRLLFVRRLVWSSRDLDHRAVRGCLQALRPEIGLYASKRICRPPVIGCFPGGLLNLHLGLLPDSRGRQPVEWSILEGRPTGVTVFLLDDGIDTGRQVVLRREVPIRAEPDLASAKRRLGERDAEFFREALERLRSPGFRPETHDGGGARHYAMSRLFRGVVEERLSRGLA